MGMKFSAARKFVGNINRINEYKEANWSLERIRRAFATQGVNLTVVAGDLPLIANQAELSRKAVSKAVVRADIQAERRNDADTDVVSLAAMVAGPT